MTELLPIPVTGKPDISSLNVPHTDPYVSMIHVTEQHLGTAIPHVSNTEYVQWLDRVAELHSDSVGFTRQRLATDGMMWFVARHEIDYKAEVWPGEEILLVTWVRDIRRVKSWREYIMYRASDKTIVCKALTLWVLVDLDSRRPVRIPETMLQAFQPLSMRM